MRRSVKRITIFTPLICLIVWIAFRTLLEHWEQQSRGAVQMERIKMNWLHLVAENRALRTKLKVIPTCTNTLAAARKYLDGPHKHSHEFEVAPMSLFTNNKVFPAESTTGGRVVERLPSARREDLQLAVQTTVQQLKEVNVQFTVEDFREGSVHTDAETGTHFELIFRNSTTKEFLKVSLVRPFCSIQMLKVSRIEDMKTTVNVILPLSKRHDAFQSFMERFYFLSMYDSDISLTVVYFGNEQLNDVKKTLRRYGNNIKVRLIELNETFSRAKALRIGATHTFQESLLFFCDVDIVFSINFLQRCRWNTIAGRQVYFPILFSLYNPRVVYPSLNKTIPPERDQLVLSKHTGFWRDFGFGMACLYRPDFERAFEPSFEQTGWGGEDVALYRKFLKDPNIRVIRSTDPSIFHIWHDKNCSPSLRPKLLKACLHSKARGEGTHIQLGMLAIDHFNSPKK